MNATSADARKIIVTEDLCNVCDTPHVEVHHQEFPEMRITGPTAAEAAERLAEQFETAIEVVTDPAHREPVRQAIADVRAFLEREGVAHPGRDL
jgi:hypothetical protein